MLFVVFALVGLAIPSWADAWAYFHPASVVSISCSVKEGIESIAGSKDDHTYWFAEASAKRKGEPDWGMTVGRFDPTLKGRHDAEKACSRWMDAATKRIKLATK